MYRKNAFRAVLSGIESFKVDSKVANEQLNAALALFKEPIDFSIESGVPMPVPFDEVVRRKAEEHKAFITDAAERAVIDNVLHVIRGSMLNLAQQALNAEMVQERYGSTRA